MLDINKNNLQQLTTQQVQKMVSAGRYKNAGECIRMAHEIRVHALGLIPTELIDKRRPNEPEEVKQYRASIYVPKTKTTISKVVNSLEKIRRSADWSIQYDASKISKRIATGETLQDYCESNYPVHSSLTNWAFSVLLRQSLIDANGIVAVMPEYIPESAAEYIRPVATFFESSQVVDFVEGEYAVLLSRDTSTYTDESGLEVKTDGKVYYIITPSEFVRYEQSAADGTLSPVSVYSHEIGKLPAWKVGGIYHARCNNDTIYESYIACMIPSLNEAAREYSDLQAEIVQHMHSEMYAYTNTECPVCHGHKEVPVLDSNGEPVLDSNGRPQYQTCKHCGGTGSVLNRSPYGMTLIQGASIGETQLPTPPIGYIQKDTTIAKLQDERIREHCKDALAAVNMEFLADTPIAQSGTAKEVDRTELNNFVNAVAENIVRNLDSIYFFINEYRYRVIVPNDEDRREMLPRVNVPMKYDILDSSTLLQEVNMARTQKSNPIIIRELEIDYAKKRFNTDNDVARYVETTFKLDPLFGIDEADKMTMLQNNGIREVDYIISCNIQRFISRAFFEHPDFYLLPQDQQIKMLEAYAEEVKKDNDAKASANPFNIPQE